MKKDLLIKIVYFLTPGALALVAYNIFPIHDALAQAQDSYQLLAPLPNFGATYNPESMGKYVENIIKLAITVAAVFAVLKIVIGGFKYMGSENMGVKKDGLDDVRGAVLGLVILAASFLILNTINPALLQFRLEIDPIKTTPKTNSPQSTNVAEVTPGVTASPLQTTREQAGIKSGPAQNIEARSENIDGARAQLKVKMDELKKACGESGTFIPQDSSMTKVGGVYVLKSQVVCNPK